LRRLVEQPPGRMREPLARGPTGRAAAVGQEVPAATM